jgi:aspartate racemase
LPPIPRRPDVKITACLTTSVSVFSGSSAGPGPNRPWTTTADSSRPGGSGGPTGAIRGVIINSIEAGRVFRNLAEADWAAVGRDLGPAVAALAAAGCQRALLASNASHLAFDVIEPPPSIPVIHIVEATRAAATRGGHRRLGLLGTRFVMESDLYPSRLGAAGIAVIPPTDRERDVVHEIYFGELVQGVIREESRAVLTGVVTAMRDRDQIDGVILGGTELALILTDPTCAGLPVLNTAQIHVDAAVDWLLGVDQG